MTRKPYPCSQCPKSFHTPEARNEHTKLRHRDEIIDPNSDDNRVGYTRRVVMGDGG